MNKQVVRLCRLQLGNLFGFNEFRHTKDQSKKKRYLGMGLLFLLLGAMLAGYAGAYAVGLCMLGMAELVPVYLYAAVSLMTLFLTFFKAGSVLFSMKGYEMLVSLPVPPYAIVISRFISMYLTNLLAGLLLVVPGIVVYGRFEKPGVLFYPVCLLGILFLPLLPLTIASILGVGITAISIRSRHKSLMEAGLMILVVVGVMVGSMLLSGKAEEIDTQALKNLAQVAAQQIGRIWPPAIWFRNAVFGDGKSLALLLAVPTLIFILFLVVIQRYFERICTALIGVKAKNNYQWKKLAAGSRRKALWRKELKRYFASGIYVSNTLVGYVMAVLACAALLIVGIDRIEEMMQLPDINSIVKSCMPFAMALFMCMTSISSCSISMEGNHFWMLQTLPLKSREIYDSKILASLTVAAPFYLMTVLLAIPAVHATVLESIFIAVIPACYLVFTAVAGITFNLAFPLLKWESEVRVVKQSVSVMCGMLTGMISTAVPLGITIAAGGRNGNLIKLGTLAVLVILTGVLYKKNEKVELLKLQQ